MKTFLVLGLFIGVLFGELSAEEYKGKNDWEFNLAPFYIWMMDMKGEVDIGSKNGEVDVPFDEIADNLEAAFIVNFEGMHKSNFGFLVDVLYMDLENTVGPSVMRSNVDLDMTLVELSGLYRTQKDKHIFDLIAGIRYAEIDIDVLVSSVGPLNGANPKKNVDWVDPLVGGRWIWNFDEELSLIARGDIGGFGVGSDSAWQVGALIEWKPFEHASILGGYRVLDIDYDEGSGANYFRYNLKTHGPIFGLNFKW